MAPTLPANPAPGKGFRGLRGAWNTATTVA